MTGSVTIPSSDLRRSATEVKRDHDHRFKWARGTRPDRSEQWLFSRPIPRNASTLRVRPHYPASHWRNFAKLNRHENQRGVARKATEAKAQLHQVVNEVRDEDHTTSESSADEDVPEPTPAADDPNVFYSFDAAMGPGHGEHILSFALARAVERFETKETEKIEKEYEFVPLEDLSLSGDGYTADDDDFELVDRPSMG